MKLQINDFSKNTRKLVLFRGIRYFQEGRVNLEKQTDRTYYFDVQGQNSIYHSVVSLSEDDTIVFSSCDCPYSLEGYCKHQVASFIKILDLNQQLSIELLENAEVLTEKPADNPVASGWSQADFVKLKSFDVGKYLSTFTREELIYVMINYMQIDMKLFMYMFHHYMIEEERLKIKHVS